LIQQGLLISCQSGYGQVLEKRAALTRQRQGLQKFTNLLAIRFRGFDPDKMLTLLVSRCGWLFSTWLLTASGLLIVAAITLVFFQFDHLVARLPEARAWLTAQNLFLMACALGCVKVLHEFGHGLACKRFGGECHEMGFMLLMFTPCLYCNVSDTWMVSSKWKRMAVSAAGIGVEATLAACCTFLWWFSEPGLFHSICLNLMFVCGVSTLLFNGNPLLRYDGYFILSDWLEIPNLQHQGAATVRRHLSNWYFGIDNRLSRPESMRQEILLFAYGMASTVYRLILTFSIMWVLYRWLQPHGLGPFVQIFVVMTASLMILNPVISLYRWANAPAQRAHIRWSGFWFKAGLSLIVLAAVALIPLPTRVSTVAMLESDQAARVYVTAEGTLSESIKPGSTVTEGQELARLMEPRLDRELARLEGLVHEHQVRLDQLERRRIHEPAVAAQIPTAREALNDAEQQYRRRQQDAERLVLRAPRAGVVIPPPSQHRSDPGSLSGWSETPLDERNRGCFLRAGTTVCLIGDRSQRVAMLVINQAQIPLVRAGQTVRLRWPESPGQVHKGEIVEVAELDIDLLTTDLVRRANLPTRITAMGRVKPVGTWYHALVHVPASQDELLPGTVGEARILVDPQSLLTQFRSWFARTFTFRLRA
jgi:putative peptide zinc metalloprotease protein